MQIKTDLEIDIQSFFEKCKITTDNDVDVLILKTNNPALLSEQKSYEIKVWGKSILNWCLSAFENFDVTEIECNTTNDILSTIKPYLKNKKYTAVFYADTPLLQNKTFLNILDYVQAKSITICQLERGWIFETESVKNSTSLSNINQYPVAKEDFFCVFNQAQLSIASDILRKRILTKHLQNGVQILDVNSCFIDDDVVIEKNVIIYPNNTILNGTIINNNVVLKPNNILNNCVINKNVELCFCVAENCTIKKSPKPFSFLSKEQ